MNTKEAIAKVDALTKALPDLNGLSGRIGYGIDPLQVYVTSWVDFRQIRHAFDGRLAQRQRQTGDAGEHYFSYTLDDCIWFVIVKEPEDELQAEADAQRQEDLDEWYIERMRAF